MLFKIVIVDRLCSSEIGVLNYQLLKVPKLKCDWVQNSYGKKVELGFILVDLYRLGYKSNLFLLASQAKQLFCIYD